MEDNFYITLPSNVKSYNYFPENTVANYKTKLATRLNLTDSWEVALVEMSYTHSWYNVQEKEMIGLIYNDGSDTITYKYTLNEGIYENIQQLIDKINETIRSARNEFKPFVSWDEKPTIREVNNRNRKVVIKQGKWQKRSLLFKPSKYLCDMLGFEYENMNKTYNEIFKKPLFDISESLYYAEQPYDLSGGYHSLYVYCDIVKPSFVGDSHTQLLRVVEIPSNVKYGEQIQNVYPSPYFVTLITNDFETIEIDIKSDTGDTVPFQFGRSIIVLHFRRKQKSL